MNIYKVTLYKLDAYIAIKIIYLMRYVIADNLSIAELLVKEEMSDMYSDILTEIELLGIKIKKNIFKIIS